jgi:hypothetical protein
MEKSIFLHGFTVVHPFGFSLLTIVYGSYGFIDSDDQCFMMISLGRQRADFRGPISSGFNGHNKQKNGLEE